MGYVDFVVLLQPLCGLHISVDIMHSVSGCFAQFLLFSISAISFTCYASGWPGCSQWGVCAVFVVVLLPILSRSRPLGWAALALQRAAPKVFYAFLWGLLRFRGE